MKWRGWLELQIVDSSGELRQQALKRGASADYCGNMLFMIELGEE